MLVMTDAMRELASTADLETVGPADLPPDGQAVTEGGWVREADGSWLLLARLRSYAGQRSAFTDRTGYEAAVNGRAVYDLDLPENGEERAALLLRRGYALVKSVLSAPTPGGIFSATGLVAVSRTATDEPTWVGMTTFWAQHDDEPPYVDVAGAGGELLLTMTTVVLQGRVNDMEL